MALQDIHILEFEAVTSTLHLMVEDLTGCNVIIQSDFATVVAYITHDGGMRSRKLFLWCLDHQISITEVHPPGQDNLITDQLSRPRYGPHAPHPDRFLSVTWALDPMVMSRLFHKRGTPVIDLFATWVTRKVERFCRRLPHPMAIPLDALGTLWVGGLMYLTP